MEGTRNPAFNSEDEISQIPHEAENESSEEININPNADKHHVEINNVLMSTNLHLSDDATTAMKGMTADVTNTSQVRVSSVRNYGRTDCTEESDRKPRDTEYWSNISKCFPQYRNVLQTLFIVILNACVLGYLITAVMFSRAQGDCDLEWCDGVGMFIILTALTYLGLIYYHVIKKFFGTLIYKNILIPIHERWNRLMTYRYLKVIIYSLPLVAVIVYLALDTADNLERLKSCIGVIVIMVLGFAFSRHPGQSLSVIFFLSFCVQILYYYGAMQWVIMKVGWLLQKSMGTTACESLNAAASIFLGMTESPLLFKPYIANLTKSEIHAVMTEGFATVAGTVMAAYIDFGVEPSHLLTASIMSAPASLCVSKLFYPETEQSKTTVGNMVLEKGDENSVLDAATKGVLLGIQLVLGIIANLIAFVSFVAFFNGVLSWLGVLVGVENLTLEFILGKVFIPLAWIMGVEWDNCEEVARLVGIKTIINEFVAYEQMGKSKAAGLLTPRSEMIATYALCGFSNLGSIGILVGGLVSMAPERRGAITEVAFRAFIAGSATCFLTASIAGMLTADEDLLPSAVTMPEFDT